MSIYFDIFMDKLVSQFGVKLATFDLKSCRRMSTILTITISF